MHGETVKFNLCMFRFTLIVRYFLFRLGYEYVNSNPNMITDIKVKFTLCQATKAQRGVEV